MKARKPIVKIISQKEYLKNSGGICPSCKSTDIEGNGQIQSDSNYAWQKIHCFLCGQEWEDQYKLTGFKLKD